MTKLLNSALRQSKPSLHTPQGRLRRLTLAVAVASMFSVAGATAPACPTGTTAYTLNTTSTDSNTAAKWSWTAGSAGPQTYTFGSSGFQVTVGISRELVDSGWPTTAITNGDYTSGVLVGNTKSGKGVNNAPGSLISKMTITPNMTVAQTSVDVYDVDRSVVNLPLGSSTYVDQMSAPGGTFTYVGTGSAQNITINNVAGGTSTATGIANCDSDKKACSNQGVTATWGNTAQGGSQSISFLSSSATDVKTNGSQQIGYENMVFCVANPVVKVQKS